MDVTEIQEPVQWLLSADLDEAVVLDGSCAVRGLCGVHRIQGSCDLGFIGLRVCRMWGLQVVGCP